MFLHYATAFSIVLWAIASIVNAGEVVKGAEDVTTVDVSIYIENL